MRGVLGKRADFIGDHGEPLAQLSGVRRLDRGVHRQQVRLAGDAADHVGDLGDLVGKTHDLLDNRSRLGGFVFTLLRLLHQHLHIAFAGGNDTGDALKRCHDLFDAGGGLLGRGALRLHLLIEYLHRGADLAELSLHDAHALVDRIHVGTHGAGVLRHLATVGRGLFGRTGQRGDRILRGGTHLLDREHVFALVLGHETHRLGQARFGSLGRVAVGRLGRGGCVRLGARFGRGVGIVPAVDAQVTGGDLLRQVL